MSCAEKVNESTYMTTWTNSTVKKFIKTESRIVVSRDEEEKGMES